ncbi:MAG: Gx transporter family protein [Oscillospiraceae bacterium]|nr:Gx transporter family protein [Oscillospiraceae bacterium]
MKTRRLALSALLATVALTIFVLEAQLPPLLPLPGFRLGLSNVVTVFALFVLGWREALAIVLVRILLGNLMTGQVSALLYALGGGLLSYAAMALLRPRLKETQIWVCGVVGSLAHNIGQMAVALLLTGTPEFLYFLPALLLCGLGTGLFTGLCAQLLRRCFRRL